MNKKNIFYWTLYDFANSIALIAFFLYFSNWLVIDHGVSDFWYNMIFFGGSILMLLSAPILGYLADKRGTELKYLRIVTLLSVLFFFLTSIVTISFSSMVLLAALCMLVANYLYQLSFVFYNPLLDYIAPPERQGFISGIGQAGNWIGQLAGILITLPFAVGALYLFGAHGRAQAFLPATIIFFLLALPMLLKFKKPQTIKTEDVPKITLKESAQKQIFLFKELISFPGVGAFLLAYFFFNDAVVTAVNNFPIYLEQVFHLSDTTKSLVIIGILVTSAIGAFATGWVADKHGLKKTLMIVLGAWIIVFPLLALTTGFIFFAALCVLVGFLYGAMWAVTRTAMVALVPKDKLNFGFSYYTLAERTSTFIGPLAWGIVTAVAMHLGPIRYRYALFTMTVFVIIGTIILAKIPKKVFERGLDK